ncbi:hypothetical protein JTE90_005763 [Oedothorax gibbosus]|uniref:Gustatory receptor n=1 Tax=Oedothorax gibbosus TaxID=931172 RepID=A0AAV6UUQ3_9ARAC|nr:hypothetical protein JTE90_005763 [Oedothorax gibbosus]
MFKNRGKVSVKEINLLVDTTNALKPILILLFFCGLDLTGSKNKWLGFLSALCFHAMCFGIIIFKTVCLVERFRWTFLVTSLLKLMTLLMWWFVYAKKPIVLTLIRELQTANGELSNKDYKKIRRFSLAAAVCAAIVLCVQPAIISFRYIIPSGSKVVCHHLKFSKDDPWSWVAVILHEIVTTYVSISLNLAVSVFYAMICYTLSKALSGDMNKRSKEKTLFMHQYALRMFQQIEEAFSAIMSILFVHFLATLFKDLVVLVFVFKSGRFVTVYAYLFNFTVYATLTTIVVLSAEGVQKSANNLRESVFRFSESPGETAQYFRISEERKHLRLTGWGLFSLKKPLLLTVVTWLITYAIIIFQLS